MVVSYTGSGEIKLYGCATYFKYISVFTKFNVMDIAYPKYKAEQGILEKIAIKKIELIFSDDYQGYLFIKYTDTYNGIWFEPDLLTYDEAKSIADRYWELQSALAEQALQEC